jgi:tetratricopeptide (TPR) repeat protein
MKILCCFMIAACMVSVAPAQKKTASPSMPDVDKLMKMSPAELEAYRKQMIQQASAQATDMSNTHHLNVNTSILPGKEIKPPVKDSKRLSMIPSRPPTRSELVNELQQSLQVVKQGIPAPKLEAIRQYTAPLTTETIHDAAMSSLYNNNPKEAIYLMLQAAAAAPDSLQALNNLGAMFNMLGAEHKAIPLLRYCLEKLPKSSIVLNNIGQSYMGLGDMLQAASYFNRCLSIDSLNIEANHSMGMLHYFKKEYDAAMPFFNRELSMAMRRSTLAMAYKMGKKFDLTALAKQKRRRNGLPEKNHFEEITLGKFSLPDFPATAKDILLGKAELDVYAASVQAEMLFWMNNATMVNAKYNGNEQPGLYFDLVQAMLDELHEEFTPEYLSNFSERDAERTQDILNVYGTALNAYQCPEAPQGSSLRLQQEFAIKCCEEKKRPLADKMVGELAGHLQPIFTVGQQRWKSYINQLVAIVQLDPSVANQSMVYNAVSGYFNYLSLGLFHFTSGDVNNLLPDCVMNYNAVNLDSMLQSEREWQMGCPPALNVEVDLKGAVIKMDCNKYAIEVGSSIMGGFEHEFKSGKSTFLLGVGAKTEFLGGVLKSEAKSQFYLTFDDNKQFSDFGIKTTAELGLSGTPMPIGGIKVGGNAAGIEISNTRSLMSGFAYSESIELKGVLTMFNQ